MFQVQSRGHIMCSLYLSFNYQPSSDVIAHINQTITNNTSLSTDAVRIFENGFNVGFGALTRGSAIRFVIASSTTLVLGTQILYGSFFLYLLDYRATCSTKDQPHPR